MPRTRKPALPAHQAKRIKLRHTVTLDPEDVARFARIEQAVPEIEGLSAAIRYAGRVTEERLTNERNER